MPYADLDDAGIWVQTQHTEKDLIKSVPGARFSTAEKLWRVPATWTSMVTLRGVFGDTLQYGDALAKWTWQLRQTRVDLALQMRTATDGDEWIADHIGVGRLRPYQESGVRWMLQAGNAVLGDEMGLGKTVQTLAAMQIAYDLGWSPLPALVVCPNSVKIQWERQAAKWFPAATPHVLPQGTVKGRKAITAAKADPSALVIMHYQAARSFSRLKAYGSNRLLKCAECEPKFGDPDLPAHRCHVHRKELNGFGFRFAILDEVHRANNPAAQQTRALWSIVHDPSVVMRWGLTGTIITENFGDVWSVMHTIAPEDFPTRTPFMERYALYAWNAFASQDVAGIRLDTRAEFFRIFDPRFRRMIKSQVAKDLPPKTRTTRWVDLAVKQRKAYSELADNLRTTLDSRPDEGSSQFVAHNHLVAATRLLQFAAGTVEITEKPDPDDIATWKISIIEPSPKLDVFEEVLDELGVGYGRTVPIVVAAEHKDLLRLTAARLDKRGVRYGVLDGDTPQGERQVVLDALQAGTLPVLLFTSSAGGEGVDMYAADTLINLQRSWSLVTELQKEARVHRIGSEIHDAIQIIDLVVRDSIEGRQIESITEKLRKLDEITRDRVSADPATVASLDAEEARLLLGGTSTELEGLLR